MTWRRFYVVVALLIGCALAAAGCNSGSPIGGQTYHASVEFPGPGPAILEIQVSADGQSIASLHWEYLSAGSVFDFMDIYSHSFAPDEVPIIDSHFSYSRELFDFDSGPITPVTGPLIVAVAGQFVSATCATGTISVVGSDESQPDAVTEYSWSAIVKQD